MGEIIYEGWVLRVLQENGCRRYDKRVFLTHIEAGEEAHRLMGFPWNRKIQAARVFVQLCDEEPPNES